MAAKTTAKKLGHREVPKFNRAEFEHRIERARKAMTEHKLDGVMVTSEANLEYLSGFMTQFAWNSPSRPWYFVVPREGDAVAVIPETGDVNWLTSSWCKNIRTWPSPRPERRLPPGPIALASGRLPASLSSASCRRRREPGTRR